MFIHVFYLGLSLGKPGLKWKTAVSFAFIFSQCHVYFQFYGNRERIKIGLFGLFVSGLNYYLGSMTFDEILEQLISNICMPLAIIVMFFSFNIFCFQIIRSLKNDFLRLNTFNKLKGLSIFLHVFLYSEHDKKSVYYKITGLLLLNTSLLVVSEYYFDGVLSIFTHLSFLGFSYLLGLICIIDYKKVSICDFLVSFFSFVASINFYYGLFRIIKGYNI